MAGGARKNGDDAFLLALACGATVEKAAEKAGLARSTAYRRLADPVFKKRLDDVRSEMVQRSMGMLTAAGLEAVKTLVALQDREQPAAARLGAARAILEYGARLREEADLTKRVEALEGQLGNDAGRRSA
jgi:type II secretory pathway component PulF